MHLRQLVPDLHRRRLVRLARVRVLSVTGGVTTSEAEARGEEPPDVATERSVDKVGGEGAEGDGEGLVGDLEEAGEPDKVAPVLDGTTNLVVVGPPLSGKTTMAATLAERCEY
eukprot:1195843-Prorocentrum_minimum.AAC.6